MGKDGPDIMEGDGQSDILWHILELFGVDTENEDEDYIEEILDNVDDDKSTIITREVVEKGVKNVLKIVDNPAEDPVYFQILGYIVLKKGAAISDDLRRKIADAAMPENDTLEFRESHAGAFGGDLGSLKYTLKKLNDERKIVLNDLREKILRHRPGQITLLIEDGGKSVHVPKIIVEEDRLIDLIEKGCSLDRVAELLDKEQPENITPEVVLQNIEYNWPLTGALDQVFENARIMFLPFFKYLVDGSSVKTPEELSERFISPENPDGIPVDDIIRIAKKKYPVPPRSCTLDMREVVKMIKYW